jgi:hypothetical protein
MAQGALPFKYEKQRQFGGMTALAGLPVYLDLAHVMGLSGSVERHLAVRAGGRGWTDAQVVTSLVLLNLAGGECVDDLDVLEADEGFCRVLRSETLGTLLISLTYSLIFFVIALEMADVDTPRCRATSANGSP